MSNISVQVEEILSKEESKGAVELIDGRGMCPPENGSGNRYNSRVSV